MIKASDYTVNNNNNTPKEGGSKPTEIGVHYGYNLADVKVLDNRIEFRYEKPETNNYMTQSIWTSSFLPLDTPEKKQNFQDIFVKRLKTLLLIFAPEEIVNTVSGATLGAFAEKAAMFFNAYKNSTKVNLGLIYSKDPKYTEISTYGVEKYTEDNVTNIKFTEWEKKNRMTATEKKAEMKTGLSDSDLPF